MSLATNVSDLATRIATEVKALRTLINGNAADLSALDTTATSNLVAAINEVYALSGGPIALDDLTDVTLTTPGGDDIIQWSGTLSAFVNRSFEDILDGWGVDVLNDVDTFTDPPTDGQALVWDNAGGNWVPGDVSPTVPDASDTVKGIVELATNAETVTGTDTVRATTPAGVDAALDARVVDASATVKGIVELATDAETTTGTDTVRATTPANVKAAIDARVVAASATVSGIVELATDAEAITGTDTVRATTPANVAAVFGDRIDTNTALGSSNTKIPSQLAAKTYIDGIIAAANALVFKGVIDASANPNYPAADAGWLYVISVAGKIGGASGPNVEAGDVIICKTDGTASGNEATVGAQWAIVQKNVDGAVTGPASSTSGDIATFNGTGGKVVQDSGVAISTDGTMASNSDAKLPTEKAVVTYAQPKDTDLTAIAALTSAANKGLQSTGTGTWALYDLTAAGKALLDDADASAQLTTLGVSTFIKTLLDDADAATARATLSVYSQAEIGSPTTDFVATFEAGLV